LFSNVEVAESYAERMKGLSGRRGMGSGGMLMVFPAEGRHGIWMPNMKFPIDIVFISSGKRVVDIRENVRPMSLRPDTWRIYRPNKKARFVLELPAGSADGVVCAGDELDFEDAP